MRRFKLSDTQRRKLLSFHNSNANAFIRFVTSDDLDLTEFHTTFIAIIKNNEVLRGKLVTLPEFDLPLFEVQNLIISHQNNVINEWVTIGSVAYFISENQNNQYQIEIKIPAILIDSKSCNLLLKALFSSQPEDKREFDYLQFSEWQNKYLKELEEDQKLFWTEREFLKKYDEKPIQSIRLQNPSKPQFERHLFSNASKINNSLQHLSTKSGVTEEECLLACWLILMHKNIQKNHLALVLNHSGRFFEELDSLVGPFENWLPMSTSISKEYTFQTVVEAIQEERALLEENLDTFSEQEPFEVGYRYVTLDIPKIEIDAFYLEEHPSNLLLDVFQSQKKTQCSFLYNTTHYSKQAIETLAEQLSVIIDEALNKYEACIQDWQTIKNKNVSQKFNKDISPETKKTIPELFDVIVNKNPNGIALVDNTNEISYKELQKKIKTLAIQLSQCKGERIALFLEPDVFIPIAMLATLYAGKSYVPIAIETPKRRLEHIISNAGIKTIITKETHKNLLSEQQCNLFLIDVIPQNENYKSIDLTTNAQADAYHIYTSGTTGFPKGVSISHKALINYTQWLGNTFKISKEHKSALVTSSAFDLGYTALWGSLLNGATLYMPEVEILEDSKQLLNYIKEKQLTFLKVTPSLLNVWQATDKNALLQCENLQYLFSGGEVFDCDVLKPLAKARPELCFINHYGPTETTIGAVAKIIKATDLHAFSQKPVIGKSIDNMKALLLDSHKCILPPGIEGQLYISGHGVANTYIGQGKLWSEKYISIDNDSKTKWYDTGDRAMWTEDGEIIYLGRKDEQIKIRGHRLELNEIESIIEKHPLLSQAAVYKDPLNQDRLIASIVPAKTAMPLKRFCQFQKEENIPWSILPNGGLLFEVNRAETEFMYQELHTSDVYTKNGIQIKDGDTIVDLGGNIGLFGLSKIWSHNYLKLISVEPVPTTFRCLQLNASLYDTDWQVFNVAIGANIGECSFANYKHHSLLSTLKPDEEEDKELLFKLAMAKYQEGLDEESQQSLKEITELQLVSETIHCEMWTLSKLIKEANIDNIDLLKIDVQRAEYDALLGLKAKDWQKIHQVVMEVQDGDNRLENCLKVLKENNFSVVVEQEDDFKDSDRYLLYAFQKEYTSSKQEKTNTSQIITPQLCDPTYFINSIKEFISDFLPKVFHPSEYRLTDSLPITPNGKLARKELDSHSYLKISGQKKTPELGVPMHLAEIWKNTLKVDDIFMEDNFFDLGGHSLKSVHIVNQVCKQFNVELSMADLLRFPRFEDFVNIVSKKLSQVKKDDVIIKNTSTLPLLPMQKQLWFLSQLKEASIAYNMTRVISIQGELNVSKLVIALQGLIKKHEVLRTQFIWKITPQQNILGIETALSKFELRRGSIHKSESSKSLQELVEEENALPFDFKKDLLFRAKLMSSSKNESVLVLSTHHIMCDGVSFEILIAELFKFYKLLTNSNDPIDTQVVIPYGTSVQHILKRIKNQSEEAKAYWKENFKGNWQPINLPLDYKRTSSLNFQGEKHTVTVPLQIIKDLESTANDAKVSTYALTVAILKILLYQWTGSKEISLGSTVSGRDSEVVEKQVGYFANTIVLRDFINESQPFKNYVSDISETVLNALQYQFIELENIISDTNVVRRNGMTVLFDVGFTWYMHEDLENWNTILESSPISVSQLDILKPPARSDLWFFVQQKEGALVWEIIYNKSLFNHKTITALGELIPKIFKKILDDPDKEISEYTSSSNLIQNSLKSNYELNI